MNKKTYIAPQVEVMDARVEKGFAGSGDTNIDSNLEHVHDTDTTDYGGFFW